MPEDAAIGNKHVSNKDLMPNAGKVELGKLRHMFRRHRRLPSL